MNREGIRCLAAETLGLKTSAYRFVDDLDDFREAVDNLGLPCFIKPIMSSSGKGQSMLKRPPISRTPGLTRNRAVALVPAESW